MKNIFKVLLSLTIISVLGCEDVDNPIEGLEQVNLFAQFGANTVEQDTVSEVNDSREITIQVPQSFEQDMVAEISFDGTAEFGTDFSISSDGLVSSSATGAFITIPFIPTNNTDNISDQEDFEITFFPSAVAEDDKILTVTLVEAVSATDPSLVIDGGRGSIRKIINFVILDAVLEVNMSPDSTTVVENSTDSLSVSLSLNYAAPEDVTLNMSTYGALAEGVDFGFGNFGASIVIPAGETEAIFKIAAIDDNVIDNPSDSLGIIISSADIGGSGFRVEVGEADSLIYYQVDEIKNITLMDAATDTLMLNSVADAGIKIFKVQMTDVSPVDVEIDYDITVVNGAAGVDYNDITGGSVTFNPGQTEVDIAIDILTNGFDSMNDVILTISLDNGSLNTVDNEVTVEADQSTAIKINN